MAETKMVTVSVNGYIRLEQQRDAAQARALEAEAEVERLKELLYVDIGDGLRSCVRCGGWGEPGHEHDVAYRHCPVGVMERAAQAAEDARGEGADGR